MNQRNESPSCSMPYQGIERRIGEDRRDGKDRRNEYGGLMYDLDLHLRRVSGQRRQNGRRETDNL
ncbi:hypothetical protein V5T82_04885 [Magnetovibrio sp. PR-2]|uniref:hypothetical protein n=1 Tax=Magnetovibrio sp. PR-2 TaxID=3120356 RepID=UPI002FCE05FD